MNSEKTIFFIRGYMRSGTNWLSNILNLHPEINCVGEFHLQMINRAFEKLYREFYTKDIQMYQDRDATILKKEFDNFIKRVVTAYCGEEHRIVGDRTPVGLVDFILPDCKYIIISRDGRDVLVSFMYHALKTNMPIVNQYPEMKEKRRLFLKNPNYFEKHPHELLDCEPCFKWVAKSWNDTLMDNRRKCDSKHFDFDYYWLEYSKMHQDPEKYRRELYTFLGADPDLALPLNDRTRPGFKKNRPLAHNRKGKVGDWSNYFTDKNRAWFKELAHEAAGVLNLEDM